jgi:hypothetical protein
MAKLELCFRPEEDSMKRRPLTKDEINELTVAAQSIAAIVNIMAIYTCDNPHGEEDDNGSVCSVFNVLEWLIKPVEDYLSNYAGEPASREPEEEPETTAQ